MARLPSLRRVAVLPFFDESSRRFNMHPGGTCKEGRGCFADCLHWCYTPQFLDNSIFTPLFRGLQHIDRTWSREEWAVAVAEGGAAARTVDKNSSARRHCVSPSSPQCWGKNGLGVYWNNRKTADKKTQTVQTMQTMQVERRPEALGRPGRAAAGGRLPNTKPTRVPGARVISRDVSK